MRVFTLLMIVTALLGVKLSCIAQATSVKDYFIPKQPVTQCVLDHPSKSDDGPSWKTFLTYTKKGANYQVFSKEVLNGMTPSFSEKTVAIIGNEIKLIRLRSKSMVGEVDKTFSPAQTLFKVPAQGQKAYWNNPVATGKDVTKCVAERVMLVLDGKNVSAIKVTEQGYYSNGKICTWAKSTEYYVKGIGLYQVKYKDGTTMSILDEMFSESSDSVSLGAVLPDDAGTGEKYASAIYGQPTNRGSGSRPSDIGSSGLEMSGWRFDITPTVEAIDDKSGVIRFKIKISSEGEVESVTKVAGNVSAAQEKLCHDKLLDSQLSKIGTEVGGATGFYTFRFRIQQ